MEIKSNIAGSIAVFELTGKLTVQTSPELNAAMESLPADVCDIDIDLANVDYIASAGLRVLVGSEKRAVAHGGRMRLLRPRESVMEIFEMTGLAEIFAIER